MMAALFLKHKTGTLLLLFENFGPGHVNYAVIEKTCHIHVFMTHHLRV